MTCERTPSLPHGGAGMKKIDNVILEAASQAGFLTDADGEFSQKLYDANMPKLRRFARLIAALSSDEQVSALRQDFLEFDAERAET